MGKQKGVKTSRPFELERIDAELESHYDCLATFSEKNDTEAAARCRKKIRDLQTKYADIMSKKFASQPQVSRALFSRDMEIARKALAKYSDAPPSDATEL